MAVHRPSRRLHCRRFFFNHLTFTENESPPYLTTCDHSQIHYCSAYFSALPTLDTPSFILCTTSLLQPRTAASCDSMYLKQSTSSHGWPFSRTCIRPKLPYLEHLKTLFLLTFTLNFFVCICYQTHSPVYTTSLLNHPLVLYYLQITAGYSQTCLHLLTVVPALSHSILPFTSRTTPPIYKLKQAWKHCHNWKHNPVSIRH